jgi:hypothetical protein
MKLNEQIKRITEMMGVISEDTHNSKVLFKTALDKNNFELFQKMVELQFIVDGNEKGKMKCGESKTFEEQNQEITTTLNCTTEMMEMVVEAGYLVWSMGGSTNVKTKLTKSSAQNMSSAGVKINNDDPAKFSIEMTLDTLSSDPEKTIDVTVGSPSAPSDTQTPSSGDFPFCVTGSKFEKRTIVNGEVYLDKDGLFIFYKNNRVMFYKQAKGSRKNMGNYTCKDSQKNYPHIISTNEYDSKYEYKVEFDDAGKVVKVETKQIKKSNWIDVSNNDKYKKPILEKVFGIEN